MLDLPRHVAWRGFSGLNGGRGCKCRGTGGSVRMRKWMSQSQRHRKVSKHTGKAFPTFSITRQENKLFASVYIHFSSSSADQATSENADGCENTLKYGYCGSLRSLTSIQHGAPYSKLSGCTGQRCRPPSTQQPQPLHIRRWQRRRLAHGVPLPMRLPAQSADL